MKEAKIRLRLPQATQTNENRANQATSYPVRETGTHLLKSPYGLYMAFERVADFREIFPFLLEYVLHVWYNRIVRR